MSTRAGPPIRSPSLSRRALLRGSLALPGIASLGASSCAQSDRENGRVVASLWFSYGGRNREVLLDLVRRFNASQSRYVVRATY